MRAAWLTVWLVLSAAPAAAWTPVMTPYGDPAWWDGTSVGIHVDPALPEGWDPEIVEDIGRAAAAAWGEDCADFQIRWDGWEASTPVSDPDDGRNVTVWRRDSWPHSSTLIALTLLTLDDTTGQITDADIEFNVAEKGYSAAFECSADALHYDLLATWTHELGHLLGLDHADLPTATMNAATFPGDCKKRTLALDDIEGFCAMYQDRPSPDDFVETAEFVEGADVGTSGGKRSRSGCAGGPPAGAGAGLAISAMWLLLAWRRRRSA